MRGAVGMGILRSASAESESESKGRGLREENLEILTSVYDTLAVDDPSRDDTIQSRSDHNIMATSTAADVSRDRAALEHDVRRAYRPSYHSEITALVQRASEARIPSSVGKE